MVEVGGVQRAVNEWVLMSEKDKPVGASRASKGKYSDRDSVRLGPSLDLEHGAKHSHTHLSSGFPRPVDFHAHRTHTQH